MLGHWDGLFGSARGLAISRAAETAAGPIAVFAANANHARQLEEEIRFYAGPTLPLVQFPDRESLPYDAFSPHPNIVSTRLEALYRLPQLARGVILTSVATVMHRLPPPEFVTGHSFFLRVGDRLDIDALRERLARVGYHVVFQVMEPGEVAIRGGLVDLFPAGSANPFRIDLFDDQVESIREFDPQTQRSGRRLTEVRLLPNREFPLAPESIQRFRQAFRTRFEGDPQRSSLYRGVSEGHAPGGIEYYLPFFFDRSGSFFDYLPKSATLVLDVGAMKSAAGFEQETHIRYEDLRHNLERPLLPPKELFLSVDELQRAAAVYPQVMLAGMDSEPDTAAVTQFNTRPPAQLPVDHKSSNPYAAFFSYLGSYPGRILIVAETPGRRETLRSLLYEHGLRPVDLAGWDDFLRNETKLGLTVAELEKGLVLDDPAIAVVTESQLYGERAAQRRRRLAATRDPDTILRSLAEVKPGDPVVHEEYGVGRYLGLQTLDVGDGPVEFMTLEYAGADKLYVPVLSLHLISRYTGVDPEHAPLHKLGSDTWEKTKQRAREKAYDAAAELLEVHALRAGRRGHAFAPRDDNYQAFADAFPFEETPDQIRAIDEVIRDMESAQPMDRLVCGDVGFGKTEVALRAAFIAMHDSKQVAVLVPTTLLANQHYQNFQDRFAGLPARIELLSRFRSAKEQDKTLADLADGKIDIVIGTHRLLQDDVRFKNLGLVILDEEHRFGVRQKERLKKLRAEVDILTLTATPIPRTLNMALAGLREISLITQAPEGRLAVKTFISQWDKSVIREAMLREIRRGGQVYFLHNDVRSIERTAEVLKELVPEAEIRIAHGQLSEHELERIMLDFYHQRFNVLLCSTIIESGIDVPSANTMLIERADKFGLAQLHQLRGRVGRSHHRAYCYLLVPDGNAMTTEARKRLEAIASLEELGAGFMLASHDLEIRGAGELLGDSQSGVIDEVGFTLYSELLERAVRTLKAGGSIEQDGIDTGGCEIDLHTPALLPEDYLPDVHLRLVLYKRIAGAKSAEALVTLKEEIIDRFGKLPPATERLFRAAELKIGAAPLGIRKIDVGPKGARIEFNAKPNVDPATFIALLQSAPRRYRLEGSTRLRIIEDMPEPEDRLKMLKAILDRLSGSEKIVPSPVGRGG
ncbi:MAG TPA: transcription-repair coupling factor [Burkholderiales bacterium]|nr:transcription-repair coupling factor [Burkholderiales bacterium]